MNDRIKCVLFGCLALTCASALLASGGAAEPRAKELRVGLPLALTGIAAQQSENVRRGVELAKEDLEKEGWKISLQYEDTTANAAQVVTVAKYLLSSGHRFFIGPIWSYMVAAAKPPVEQAGAVIISPITSSELIDGPSANIFHGVPKHSLTIAAVKAWLKDQGARKAVILTSETTWGRLHEGVFRKAAEHNGVEVAHLDSYPLDAEEMTVGMFALKTKQMNPDVAMVDLNKNGAALFLRKLAELHAPVKILATTKFKEAVELGLVSESTLAQGVWILDLPMEASFATRYRNAYHEEPELSADSAYDSLIILARAVEATDGSPSAVKRHLHGNFELRGYGGSYRFDHNGDSNRVDWVTKKLD